MKITCNTNVCDLRTPSDIAAAWNYAICNKHTGKMAGMLSLSTTCRCNPSCLRRIAAGVGVCAHCYSDTQQRHQPNTQHKLEFNSRFFTFAVWPVETIPFINSHLFRLESFGDLFPVADGGINQVKNYFNFAAKNAHCDFALWTKNPEVIAAAIADGAIVPENLEIVYSIFSLNCKDPGKILELLRARYPFISRVFAVYTEDGPAINCGARSCLTCGACYRKDGPAVIRELLK